jgi:hypothetical protein
MFERIKNYFRDVRISLDFPQHERQCRCEHEQQAERQFSTKQLDDESGKLLTRIGALASSQFDSLIKTKEEGRERFQSSANDTKSKLSYFLRFYKKELDELQTAKDVLFSQKRELYEKKNKVKDLLSVAFEEKDKAYSELNYYKERIDSWYAKSDRTPWLFGNAGKELPKHSFFGQSFGDLDSYKYHRNSAHDDAQEAKSRIGNLKQDQHELGTEIAQLKREIDALFDQINHVKKDQFTMHELKKAGHNKQDLQTKLDGIHTAINKLSSEINGLESSKREFIILEKHRHGVMDLESTIREIKQKKGQFLGSFDLEPNQQERKRLHRETWLKKRNIA